MSVTELCGFKVNDKIKSPEPFTGEATIVGFRYYTSRNTGRTCMVADYITDDGKASFDPIAKLVKERARAPKLPAEPEPISDRERDTILAALRLWQRDGASAPSEIQEIADNGIVGNALNAEEIDTLCERLNS